MPLLSIILVLCIVGVVMYLLHAYVPAPWSWVLLVLCGVILVLFLIQLLGVADLGSVRVGD